MTDRRATQGGLTADEHRAAAANYEALADECFALGQEWEKLDEPGMAAREKDIARHHRASAAKHLAAAEGLDEADRIDDGFEAIPLVRALRRLEGR